MFEFLQKNGPANILGSLKGICCLNLIGAEVLSSGMGAFRIIYVFTTMFSLAYCYEYSFAFDVPAILNSFTNMATQALISSQAWITARASEDPDAIVDSDVEGPTLVGRLQKVTWDVVGYMAGMLNSLSRRMTAMKPNVEMGPGTFKSEQVTYPPQYFINRLKMLLKLKKKEEEKKKPLNKPEK